MMNSDKEYYRLVINGASVAATGIPCNPVPGVWPTPEQLIGYTTRYEQLGRQQFMLNAPIEDVDE